MAGNPGNSSTVYESRGGVRISVDVSNVDGANAIEHLIDSLDTHLGVVLASGYEYPGRYTRRDFGFIDPPIVIQGGDREARIEAGAATGGGGGRGRTRRQGGRGSGRRRGRPGDRQAPAPWPG